MTSNRQKYKAEYNSLLELQRTIAYRSVGFVCAMASINQSQLGPNAFKQMCTIANDFEKVSEEIKHLETLLDLIDNNDGTDHGEWS